MCDVNFPKLWSELCKDGACPTLEFAQAVEDAYNSLKTDAAQDEFMVELEDFLVTSRNLQITDVMKILQNAKEKDGLVYVPKVMRDDPSIVPDDTIFEDEDPFFVADVSAFDRTTNEYIKIFKKIDDDGYRGRNMEVMLLDYIDNLETYEAHCAFLKGLVIYFAKFAESDFSELGTDVKSALIDVIGQEKYSEIITAAILKHDPNVNPELRAE